jgi:hypothetical protein
MAHGKKITLFLMDGDPNGRWTCELSNWTGKAYKIPRTLLKDCATRADLKQAGVYFLLGRSSDNGKSLAYIGEAENVFDRLSQHLVEKDFWNEVITFTSKDKNLNKAHVKYLENRFHELAVSAKRYHVQNNNIPTKPVLSEPEQAELEEYIEHALVLVNALGHRLFEAIVSVQPENKDTQIFFLKKSKVQQARGVQTPDGFAVFAGASVSEKLSTKSLSKGIIALREKYTAEGKILNGKTTEDILFPSSSTAADFILGYSVSGPAQWKTAEGVSLKEIENKENVFANAL